MNYDLIVIGGGPAGLYLAILMKKANPHSRITVIERNGPQDTFGFGVVLADTGIELAVADVPSAWLNSGVPVGAGDFLESVTSSARRRHGLQ